MDEWRIIDEFPRYEMNQDGVVRKHKGRHGVLSVQQGNGAYLFLWRDGKAYKRGLLTLMNNVWGV